MSAKKMYTKAKFQALIIGAGRIASSFDTPRSREILTHAHAYTSNPRFTLAGFIDTNVQAARHAARIWNTTVFANPEDAFSRVPIDVVSICTPDSTHASILRSISSYRPKLVIVEKPFTTSVSEGKHLESLCRRNQIDLLINYSRRFDDSMGQLRKDIAARRYGNVLGAQGWYTKGLLHHGTHLIDLCRFLFGEIKTARALTKRDDFVPADPSVSFFAALEQCPSLLVNVADEGAFGIFELDIMFERGRVRLTDYTFKAEWYRVKRDVRYPEYRALVPHSVRPTGLSLAMQNLIAEAAKILSGSARPRCTAEDAIAAQKIVASLLRQIP